MKESRPLASSAEASRRMRAARQRDTKPEVALRKALHAAGLRFRVDRKLLVSSSGRADLVFARSKVAVFVDGCFWHSCPIHATKPKLNGRWWARKLATNRGRDKKASRMLKQAGWSVIRVWEHECPEPAAARIIEAIRAAKKTSY